MTVGEYLDLWLVQSARPRLSAGTFADYSSLLDRWIRPAIGERPLGAVTPLELQAMYSRMIERGLGRTIQYTHAVLHTALETAVRWRLIPYNPAAGVELPRLHRREMTVLDVAQVCRVLRAFRGTRDRVLVLFAVTTGMRPGEYLALKWSDVRGDVAWVQRALARGGMGFKEPKRAHSRRAVRLVPTAERALRYQRSVIAKRRAAAGADWTDNDLVFPDPLGHADRPKALSHRFSRVIRMLDDVPRIRLYDLRHTAATIMLAAGVPAKLVSEQLGHASVAFTMDIYAHVLTSMEQVAAEKVESLLFR